MQFLSIFLMVYGVVCLFILIAKPPVFWNMAKFKVMIKMMGETGFKVFLLLWGTAFLVAGYLLYK